MINEFETWPEAEECAQIIKRDGAALMKGFVSPLVRLMVLSAVESVDLAQHDALDKPVSEQFSHKAWRHPGESPPAIRTIGRLVLDYFGDGFPQWQPNEALIQRYYPADYGIDWHRDYSRDQYLIAVGTIEGSAKFEVELTRGTAAAAWQVEAGDLVLMRGHGLNQGVDDRPRHRIHPPVMSQRTAVSFRHVEGDKVGSW